MVVIKNGSNSTQDAMRERTVVHWIVKKLHLKLSGVVGLVTTAWGGFHLFVLRPGMCRRSTPTLKSGARSRSFSRALPSDRPSPVGPVVTHGVGLCAG